MIRLFKSPLFISILPAKIGCIIQKKRKQLDQTPLQVHAI